MGVVTAVTAGPSRQATRMSEATRSKWKGEDGIYESLKYAPISFTVPTVKGVVEPNGVVRVLPLCDRLVST